MDLVEALLIDSGAFFLFGGASAGTKSHEWRSFQAGENTASRILQTKGSERNYFLLCPGLQRFSAGLPFANRVVLMAVWLRNQREIRGEMHAIQRTTHLERCEPDKT
jgi:hypothetical protein